MVDIFEYLAGVTAQRIDPPTLEPCRFLVDDGIVLCSPLRRASECLRLIDGANCMQIDELKEIPFDLQGLCTKKEWDKEKSIIVRRKFKEAFIADTLLIPREQIFEEIRSVLRKCEILQMNGTVTVLSHSFRLKLIEGYIKSNGKIVSSPEVIHDFISDNQKTYDFGGGFEIGKTEIILTQKH